ncbi:MAG TPA: amino acid permease [Chthoniobacterales bacterium]|jgi:APA family basic amino acid/polyamine antiporter|nr:amino acid permease [Chthoniobacterales bacterium]
MALSLFRKKSPDHLIAEAAMPERQMKRALGPLALTCIGIGAIIGTGIFALAGTAAAGEQIEASIWKTPILNFMQSWMSHAPLVFGRPGAGPAVMVSFVVAGVACGFAALCYAELASMIPVSGSAYTYSYATLGEIIAWIIGWDLILEYAVGNMAVAVGWSGYFVRLCGSLFGLKFPVWAVNALDTAKGIVAQGGDALSNYSSTTIPTVLGYPIALNIPALLIVAAVTILLIYGIRESARTNNAIVITKLAVVIFVIAFGAFMIHPTNWQPFVPTGIGGVMSGAAIVFFAFIGFDAVSTTAEETRNPQRDMPIGIIASLIICTILYVLMAAVITGVRKYTIYFGDPAAVATAFAAYPWATALISAGALAGISSVLLVFQLGQPRIFMAMARDGLLPRYFAKIHPRFRTPHITTIWTGIFVGGVAAVVDIGSLADLTNIGTLFAFILVCLGVVILRRTDKNRPRPFRVPMTPIFPILGVIFCFVLMLSLPLETWIRFLVWLAIGLTIYFLYSVRHSKLRGGEDTGITEDIPPPIVKT